VDLGLDGTAAIVCGASSGMGLAIARTLTGEGASVTMVARDPDRLADAAGSVAGALQVPGDVRNAAVLERAVEETVRARGRLDIVVNNAGGPPPGTFDSTPAEAWADAFELSLHSGIRLTRLALPHLRRSGRGRVVNITSTSVREPIPHLLLSNTIRPGVVGWAKSIAHELGPDRITVNTIAPGSIDTPRVQQLWAHAPDPAAAREQDLQAIPAGRLGSPAEIGAAVAFLCSTQAAYISGVVLAVDGARLHGVW
jgi:3-oxoacyl-[acyl-carrier protein] reductase